MSIAGAMRKAAKRVNKAASKQTAGQKKVEQATKGQRAYARGQIKGAMAGGAAAGLTAAVVGKMSVDEMRMRLKNETDEKNRALLREGIAKAVAEASSTGMKGDNTRGTSPKPKLRPKEMAKGGMANCGASMKATQKSTQGIK